MSINTESRLSIVKDNLTAELLGVGSTLASVLPSRFNFIGYDPHESYTPLEWRHLRRATTAKRQPWYHFPGIDTAGRTPRNYAAAALLLIDRQIMDAGLSNYAPEAVRPAVAYKLGSAVMVGSSPSFVSFGLLHEDEPDYRVAMRIGSGPLEVQVGIDVNPFGSRARTYVPLTEGVRVDDVLPISSIGSRTPLV